MKGPTLGQEPVRPPLLQRLRRRVIREVPKLPLRTVRARNRRPMISFTFDDVTRTAFTTAAAMLDASGLNGTFYIAGDLCGTSSSVADFIARDECVALHRQGHEIGCHTFSHVNVRTLPHAGLAQEAQGNARFFRDLDGIVLENFAYPFGAASLARKAQLQRTFRSCRGTAPGINAGRVDPGFLRAVEIQGGLGQGTALQAWMDEARRRTGWLILVAHDVSDNPTPWGCTTALFADTLRRALASGCEIVSVREALDRAGIGQRLSSSGVARAIACGRGEAQ